MKTNLVSKVLGIALAGVISVNAYCQTRPNVTSMLREVSPCSIEYVTQAGRLKEVRVYDIKKKQHVECRMYLKSLSKVEAEKRTQELAKKCPLGKQAFNEYIK